MKSKYEEVTIEKNIFEFAYKKGKMMEKLISIIIPIYNVPEKYLKNCLDSVANQTYKNYEAILVDDGSTDNSGKIAKKYSEKYENFKFFRKENGGLSSARNFGFKKCSTAWFMFLDADDNLNIKTCEILEKKIKKNGNDNNLDVICFGTIKKYKHKDMVYTYGNKFINNHIYDNKYMVSNVLDFDSQIGDATAKLIKYSFAKKYDIMHDENVKQGVEGLLYCFKLFLNSKKTLFIDDLLYNYTCNPQSITMSDIPQKQEYVFEGMKKIYDIIQKEELDYMIPKFYKRMNYIIVAAAISIYFSPNRKQSFLKKKAEFKEYLNVDIIKKTFDYPIDKSIDWKRKFIIKCIKHKKFFIVDILAYLRYIERRI